MPPEISNIEQTCAAMKSHDLTRVAGACRVALQGTILGSNVMSPLLRPPEGGDVERQAYEAIKEHTVNPQGLEVFTSLISPFARAIGHFAGGPVVADPSIRIPGTHESGGRFVAPSEVDRYRSLSDAVTSYARSLDDPQKAKGFAERVIYASNPALDADRIATDVRTIYAIAEDTDRYFELFPRAVAATTAPSGLPVRQVATFAEAFAAACPRPPQPFDCPASDSDNPTAR